MGDPVRAAIESGLEFLRAAQGVDGLWRDFLTPAGEASTWPTAYIGHAVRLAGSEVAVGSDVVDPLERASRALALRQQLDGGWGYNEATPSDADSTAWAVLFLSGMRPSGMRPSGMRPSGMRRADRACQRAGSFLATCQRRSGGVATYAQAKPIRRYVGLRRWVPFRGWCSPQVEVSAVAGRAHCALASERSRARAGAAWRYVRSRQNSDGSWSSYWWTSPHVATHEAVALALRLCDRDAVSRAREWALRGQRPDGGWGSVGAGTSSFETALGLSVLTGSRRGDPLPVAHGVDALLRLQQADGGWPSDAALRVPVPPDARPAGDDRWHLVRFDGGLVVRDQHRSFTTAACVAALARAAHRTR